MAATQPREVARLDVGRPRQARADLAVNRSQSPVGRLIGEAMRRTEGGQKGAAASLRRDEAQLSRELLAGTLRVRDLDDLSDALRAEVGSLLLDTYGAARVHPIDRAASLLVEVTQALLEAKR